jgi:hypothetical protein
MSHLPYIGVTGYTNPNQAAEVHENVKHLFGDRTLMDGYLMRADQFDRRWEGDDVERPSLYQTRFLSIADAEQVFDGSGHGTLRMIHLCPEVPNGLDEQFALFVERLGTGVDGFQINWLDHPDPAELASFKAEQDQSRRVRDLAALVIVLQLHPNVLAERGDPSALVDYVAEYVEADAVTDVLYDPSGGKGREFDTNTAIDALDRLHRSFPTLQFGVAGGLSADNVVEKVGPVWRHHPDVSIDVEGRVRDQQTDALNLDEVKRYVRNAMQCP